MARKPINRNWGKAMNLKEKHGEQNVCEFDKQVIKLELLPGQLQNSSALYTWVKRNHTKRYVPEELLLAWNITTSLFGEE